MEQSYEEAIAYARELAYRQIDNPRERDIIVQYLEDALCRAAAGHRLTKLVPPKG